MPAPKNLFKQALKDEKAQIGIWVALANPISMEISAGAGFDWLVIDGEHAPNDLRSILGQLQAASSYDSHPVVRVPVGEVSLIKQMLDLGAQTILVPMIEAEEHAIEMARAMRYPPHGIRGIGAALARASRFNTIPDYLKTANDEVCLLLQVESRKGLENLEKIAKVTGVDGVFIGPADLAADMGYLGNPAAPEVQEAVENAIKTIIACGKPAGILTGDLKLAKRYLELGATFVAVGHDVGALSSGLKALRANFS